MNPLIYLHKVPASLQAAFDKKVRIYSAALGIDPNWLMQVMYSESGVNPQAVNPTGGATGLIQFMPKTAEGLGTTTAALKELNHVEQLDWVYKYFLPFKGKMKSYYDVYAVTFFPAMVGKPDSWVLQTSKLSAGIIAKQNPVIDQVKDGKITVGEFKTYVYKTVKGQSYRDIVFGKIQEAANNGTAMLVLLGVGFFF